METLAGDDKLAAMRVLLLNLNSETNELVSSALAGQGYDVTTESGLTVDEVLALSPEVLVIEASPTDFNLHGRLARIQLQAIALYRLVDGCGRHPRPFDDLVVSDLVPIRLGQQRLEDIQNGFVASPASLLQGLAWRGPARRAPSRRHQVSR